MVCFGLSDETNERVRNAIATGAEWLSEDHPAVQCLEHGVALHHGGSASTVSERSGASAPIGRLPTDRGVANVGARLEPIGERSSRAFDLAQPRNHPDGRVRQRRRTRWPSLRRRRRIGSPHRLGEFDAESEPGGAKLGPARGCGQGAVGSERHPQVVAEHLRSNRRGGRCPRGRTRRLRHRQLGGVELQRCRRSEAEDEGR